MSCGSQREQPPARTRARAGDAPASPHDTTVSSNAATTQSVPRLHMRPVMQLRDLQADRCWASLAYPATIHSSHARWRKFVSRRAPLGACISGPHLWPRDTGRMHRSRRAVYVQIVYTEQTIVKCIEPKVKTRWLGCHLHNSTPTWLSSMPFQATP
jgi:hypothetical protein